MLYTYALHCTYVRMCVCVCMYVHGVLDIDTFLGFKSVFVVLFPLLLAPSPRPPLSHLPFSSSTPHTHQPHSLPSPPITPPSRPLPLPLHPHPLPFPSPPSHPNPLLFLSHHTPIPLLSSLPITPQSPSLPLPTHPHPLPSPSPPVTPQSPSLPLPSHPHALPSGKRAYEGCHSRAALPLQADRVRR